MLKGKDLLSIHELSLDETAEILVIFYNFLKIVILINKFLFIDTNKREEKKTINNIILQI